MTRSHYRHPPVEEALCEFHFAGGAQPDFEMIFSLHGRLKQDYPGKMRSQQGMQTDFQTTPEQVEPTISVKHGASRVQFVTADLTRIVAVGSDVLSVHCLRPYEGWDPAFRNRITQALAVYREVAKPAELRQLVFRYVNRIELPSGVIRLDEYFTHPPRMPEGVPIMMHNVVSRIDGFYEGESIKAAVTFATLTAVEGKAAFLLDIGISQEWKAEAPASLDDAMATAENLKFRGSTVFEAMITDESRRIFNADPG